MAKHFNAIIANFRQFMMPLLYIQCFHNLFIGIQSTYRITTSKT